ncbi:hypothetical protein K701_13435 [Streptomyces fradiae ATCC 10745 = DSM 40063]|uniref:Secreted protein n=1 Tax=Streptomyces fradiae ATCC 10745 = DSM 40063 TaxID=1319510 RepID=A0ABQ6XUM3_STRFR|nr:hypothetical protein K701_13435 [Streptomyces fradiae ATCC 10745 = DSM 40063]
MTSSAPSSLTRSTLAVLAVVATYAPSALASWTAMEPRPPAPAWMKTFWPGCTWARSIRACQAVSATRGREAASVMVSVADWGRGRPGGRRGVRRRCAVLVRPRVDLVAHGEAVDGRSDPDDGPGEVVAQDERETVGHDRLEVTFADLHVQRVETPAAWILTRTSSALT